jgi:peptidoglycan hydrolase CwlO-like protein
VSVTEERVVMDSEWTDKRMNDFAGRVDRFEGGVKERFDRVDREIDKVDQRFDRFEGDVKEDFARVDARFDKVDARFDKVDSRFDKVEADSKELGGKIDKMTRRLTGGLITVVGAVVIKVFLS